MNKKVTSYIDNVLIFNYAGENNAFDTSDIDKNDKAHFLDLLMEHDDTLREIVSDYMQNLIDERLEITKWEYLVSCGFTPRNDRVNGEVFWTQGNFA